MAFRPSVPEEVRATWLDLAARYRFSYGMTLQERLDLPAIRTDVNAWWGIGGQRDPGFRHNRRAPHVLDEPNV